MSSSTIKHTVAAAAATLACAGPALAHTFVYVAHGTDISSYQVMADDGVLAPGPRIDAGGNAMPMAVSPDRHFLFVAVRSKPYAVRTYAIDKTSGNLTLASNAPLAESMAFISLDKTGRTLYGASYGGHLISVNQVDADGRVSEEAVQVMPLGRNPHAIRVDESNQFVYVTSLGTDQVFQFRRDAKTGKLSPNTPASVALAPVTGPRHFVTSRDQRFLFAVTEMRGSVITFGIDGKTGLLTELSSAPGVAPDSKLVPGQVRGTPGPDGAPRDNSRDIWASDIHLTPDGKFLYIAERTSSSLARFGVDQASGKLTYLGSTPTENTPRSFAIDPKGRFLIASGEKSDTISVYAIDAASGALGAPKQYATGKGASWVEIVSTH